MPSLSTQPPPPCISYANAHNYYSPYAYRSLAINSGKFSVRSPPTDLCPLIQCIVSHMAAKPPPQFVHGYGARGAATICPTAAWKRAWLARNTYNCRHTCAHVRRPHVLKLAIQDLWDASDLKK